VAVAGGAVGDDLGDVQARQGEVVPGASSARWAVLSGQTKKVAPARASLVTLSARIARIVA
jgi:hypothetical protein